MAINVINRVRCGGIMGVVVASVAIAAGAAGVRADSAAPGELAAAEEIPPRFDPVVMEREAAPTAPLPTDIAAPSTLPPSEPTAPEVVPSTTVPPLAPMSLLAVKAPTAPRSLSAVPANASVQLKWLAPSSDGGAKVDKYAVQRYVPGTGWKPVASPTTTGHTVDGLTNGTNYSFRVRARNVAGWGPYSTVVSATPRTVPTAPRSPMATPSNASVQLTWLAPSSNGGAKVDKYAVQRYVPGTGWTPVASPTTTGHTVDGLTNGTNYSFRVRAHNAAGWGPYSTVVTVVPRTVPGAPAVLVVTAGIGTVQLEWQQPSNDGGVAIDSYLVRWVASTGGFWTGVVVGPTTLIHEVTGLTNGTTYWFQILAHSSAGWGPASAGVTAMPATKPGVPTDCVAFEGVAPRSMHVDWNAPVSNGGSPITYYQLDLIKYTQGEGTIISTGQIAANDTDHYLIVPESGTYVAAIRAANVVGLGESNCGATVTIAS